MGFLPKKKKAERKGEDYLGISRKYQLKRGRAYVVEEPSPDISFDAFVNIISTEEKGYPRTVGLAVSRTHPDLIRQKYGLEGTRIYWLATMAGPDVISPTSLGILTSTVVKFITGNPSGAVLLDGIEYLVSNNDFNKVLRVIDQVNDHISQSKAILILPADPRAFDTKELALIERNMERIGGGQRPS